ncbi:EF2563 family selenium-dependent molybdenum hydroxylase system protein [Christensenellaceae bacterium OttesenSCG-928-L17]|nr:EF2563 family selenium-dependent molybdenum hydroxylase system protein [Christensenellaceae bacterium OttesenSCG-928-L17]
MLVVIKGAGDIASGIALRLHHARFDVIMTELAAPTAIRRTVCFSSAVLEGEMRLEGVLARFAKTPEDALQITKEGDIAVLVDPKAQSVPALKPVAVVDAILAKKNTGTQVTDAPVVVGVGPGFYAGRDCHAVVETQRGHDLGRVIVKGAAVPNSGTREEARRARVLRAPCAGVFQPVQEIGARVQAETLVAIVSGEGIYAIVSGTLRGMLPDNAPVTKGMKCGDIDPHCEVADCYSASGRALAVGGGVLEAILRCMPL